jgi:hypothetical protein
VVLPSFDPLDFQGLKLFGTERVVLSSKFEVINHNFIQAVIIFPAGLKYGLRAPGAEEIQDIRRRLFFSSRFLIINKYSFQ